MRSKIWIMAASIGLLVFLYNEVKAGQWTEVQLKNCNFKVMFPQPPVIEQITITRKTGKITWESALVSSADGIFFHECICPSSGLDPKKGNVKEVLSEFVHKAGLSNVEYSMIPFPEGTAMEAKGYKAVNGALGMGVGRYYVTRRCIAEFITGSELSKYPTKATTRFYQSIRSSL